MRFPRARRTGKDPAPGVTLQDSRKAYETARGFGVHLVGLGPGWRASKARSPSLRCSSGTQSCGWGYPTRRYAGVVAASCAASRACRSCSKEAADYGVTADVPHTVAAPCFRLWAGSASRDTELTGERKNNIGLSMSRPGCLCRGIALRRSYLGVATRGHLTLLFIFSLSSLTPSGLYTFSTFVLSSN